MTSTGIRSRIQSLRPTVRSHEARSKGGATLGRCLIALAAVAGILGASTGSAQVITIVAPDTVWVDEGSLLTFDVAVLDPTMCNYVFTGAAFLPTGLPTGNDITWNPPVNTATRYYGDQTFTFTWTPTFDDAGTYSIINTTQGSLCRSFHRTTVVVREAGGTPQFGSVSGHVVADCPSSGTPLYGVPVDVVESGSGNLLGSATTAADGSYAIANVPVGPCDVNIATPLGYAVSSPSNAVEVLAGQDVVSDFDLACNAVTSTAHGSGYWRHQFAVATGGNGKAQIDAEALCSYLDVIADHFNDNDVNPVVIYLPPGTGACIDKLWEGRVLLNLQGSASKIDRARQQLFALLLNAAAGDLGLFQVASEDGATVSQAITYCDNVIDDPYGDYATAMSVAAMVNGGTLVPAGVIPLGTANIAYRGPTLLQFAAGPSPASGSRTFRFAMARSGKVALRVFDVRGRLVSRVFDGVLSAGWHTIGWNGRTANGSVPAAGIYLAQLTTGSETMRAKLVQTNR